MIEINHHHHGGNMSTPSIRAALACWGTPATPPVPTGDDSAWRQQLGWRNSSGECWWSSGPHGPWQLINPGMVYPAGWLLPYRAIPRLRLGILPPLQPNHEHPNAPCRTEAVERAGRRGQRQWRRP
jgi:hypothetical protein